MNQSESMPRLAVQSLEDLVGLVPYLIGFHPAESLVVIVIECGRVSLTARASLEDVGDRVALEALLGRLFERHAGAEGWFLAYSGDEDRAWRVLRGCQELFGSQRLGRLVHVGARSWCADHPAGPGAELKVTASAAQAAMLGLSARRSRAELGEQVAGPPESEFPELARHFEQASVLLAKLAPDARNQQLSRLMGQADPDPADYARLALLVADPEGLLAVLSRLCLIDAPGQVRLWNGVLRHCLPEHQAPVLGLLGFSAWLAGDGALQMVCLERLDQLDPWAPMAALLDWLNAAVLPPREWPGYRNALLAALRDQFTIAGRPASPRNR